MKEKITIWKTVTEEKGKQIVTYNHFEESWVTGNFPLPLSPDFLQQKNWQKQKWVKVFGYLIDGQVIDSKKLFGSAETENTQPVKDTIVSKDVLADVMHGLISGARANRRESDLYKLLQAKNDEELLRYVDFLVTKINLTITQVLIDRGYDNKVFEFIRQFPVRYNAEKDAERKISSCCCVDRATRTMLKELSHYKKEQQGSVSFGK